MAPKPGEKAPDFTLPSTRGRLRLRELFKKGKVILAFYTEDNTPTCSSQVGLLKEDYELVRQLGAEVIAISADSLDSHRRFAERMGGIPFALASDETLEVARAYGVLSDDGKRSRRAIFVIDEEGVILESVPWFHPSNPSHYEAVFRALGFEV